MDSTRWEKIQSLFHRAADLPDQEQRAFLKSECGENDSFQADVLSMLQQDADPTSLRDRSVGRIAEQVFSTGASSVPPDKQFGPYHVIRVLGEGGMGVVYLAERKDLSSLVAIKVLRDAWLSPARRERFASEQRTLARLNHSSIARLYDADTLADGTPFFVMEYVEGEPLTEYCRDHQCSMDERLKLFRAVCEAVQFAHGQAVIHRDLKPSNILVKDNGAIRLLDFGIAKQLESLDTPVDQAITGLRLMTPAYAAPEQIRGDRIGIHIDVYSLGVILFELLANRLPFDLSNLTPVEAATIIAEHEPGKPSATATLADGDAFRPAVSHAAWKDLDVLCLTAMHKDPQRRYRSVEALIRDIDHYMKGEPLDAQPDSRRYKMMKFARRNQRPLALAAMVLAIVVGLVIFFTVRLARARDAALAEAARTQRIQRFMMNLFQGGNAAVGPSDSLRVGTLVERGVQEAKTLNTDPKVQAELYLNLGSIYQQLGKFAEADSLLRSALEQRRTLFGQNSPEVAETMVALSLLLADQAKLQEAEQFASQALAMSKQVLPPNHPVVARATFALGKIQEGRGAYTQAIQTLDEAAQLRSSGDTAPADLAASLSELANAHFYAGHYDTSDALNRRVLDMQRKLYGDRRPATTRNASASTGRLWTSFNHGTEPIIPRPPIP